VGDTGRVFNSKAFRNEQENQPQYIVQYNARHCTVRIFVESGGGFDGGVCGVGCGVVVNVILLVLLLYFIGLSIYLSMRLDDAMGKIRSLEIKNHWLMRLLGEEQEDE
jgi:hypothetical protein